MRSVPPRYRYALPPILPSATLQSLPLEVISNIVANTTDTPTLLSWTRVNSFFSWDAHNELYGRPIRCVEGADGEQRFVGGKVVHLHTSRAAILYIMQTQKGRYGARARHIDLVLDVEFFSTYAPNYKVSPDAWFIGRPMADIEYTWNPAKYARRSHKSVPGEVETLHFTLTDKHYQLKDQESSGLALHIPWVLNLLVPWGGPRHFRWQILDFVPYNDIKSSETNNSCQCKCNCLPIDPYCTGEMCACIPRQVSGCKSLSLVQLSWPNLLSIERPPLPRFYRITDGLAFPRADGFPGIQHDATNYRQRPTLAPDYIAPEYRRSVMLGLNVRPMPDPYPGYHRFSFTHPDRCRPPPKMPRYTDLETCLLGPKAIDEELLPCRCSKLDKWGRILFPPEHTITWLTHSDEWRDIIVHSPWDKSFDLQAYWRRKKAEEREWVKERESWAGLYPVQGGVQERVHQHRGPADPKFATGLKRKRYCVHTMYLLSESGRQRVKNRAKEMRFLAGPLL
ncbi:hypothetical protein IAT38_002097 [Cryptococcus sp. DSM 104549]